MAKRNTSKRAAKRGKATRKATGKTSSRKASKRKVATTSRKKVARKSSKTSGKASRPARKRVKNAVLVEQSRQVHCEAQMLRSAVSLLTGDGSSSLSQGVEDRAHRNALNESFLLHFRPLLDFFWEGRAGKKEVVARDFFATPRRWKPAKPQDYRELKKRLAKEIVALTTTRYSDLSIEEWPYRRIFDEIFVDIDRFQSTAPEESLHECWRERPIAAISAEGTGSSTVTGTGFGDGVLRSACESESSECGRTETDESETEAEVTGATAAVESGSPFGGKFTPPDWLKPTEDEEQPEEEESGEPAFARGFGTLGKHED